MKTIQLTNAEKVLLNNVVEYEYNGEKLQSTLDDILNDILLCAEMKVINNKPYFFVPLKVEDIYHPLDQKYYNILVENGINPFEYMFGDYGIGKIIN